MRGRHQRAAMWFRRNASPSLGRVELAERPGEHRGQRYANIVIATILAFDGVA